MKELSSQKISFVTVCHLITLIVLYLLCKANVATAIACYSCVSMNKSNPPCEDPVSAHITIQRPCRQTIPGHEGLFYAHYCSKIKGIRQKDGSSLLIRRCSMDKLTDIPTHCGQFQLDDDLYHGCIATCSKDWCNTGDRSSVSVRMLTFCLLTLSYTVIL